MIKDERRAFLATCALLTAAAVCSIVVLAAPRPVQPSQLPALRLPRGEVERVLRADRERATHAPRIEGPLQRWLELYSEEGLNERETSVDANMVAEQRGELKLLVLELFPKLGRDGVRALMASITDRALASLSRATPPVEAYGLLGVFPALAVRYGYIDAEGERLAPELALRALYKVRFNMICERDGESDLDPLELCAYEGWNALHAAEVTPSRRAQAAAAFLRAGGTDAREALAIWQFQGGMTAQAAETFADEYRRTGALRLRNMGLYAARN